MMNVDFKLIIIITTIIIIINIIISLAFGLNNWGQLGVGHRSEEVEKPERIPFLEDMTVCQAALSQHTTAILTATGEVYVLPIKR